MLRRLWTTFKRDNLINWRNYFVAITALVALVYIALVRWVVPGDVSATASVFVVDHTSDRLTALDAAGRDELAFVVVDDTAAMEAGMADVTNSVGIALEDGEPIPEVQYYFQPYHSPQIRNLMVALTETRLRELYGVEGRTYATRIEQQVLREDVAAYDDIPFNRLMVPSLLFSDPAMIGLVFIAVLIFMEKDEGTLRAYLVTPGRTWEYLLSKGLSMAALAVGFTLVFVPATVGLGGPNWLYLLVLIALGAMFSTLLGAAVAVFYDNISQYMFPAVILMLFISLPGIAYYVPSFSPAWLRWLPTYPLAYGLREAIFPTGNVQLVVQAVLWTLVAIVAALALASWTFQRQIVRK